MSPDQKARRLLDIADRIIAVRALVKGAEVVATQIDGEEANAVWEILDEVGKRLRCISDDLHEVRPLTVAA